MNNIKSTENEWELGSDLGWMSGVMGKCQNEPESL